MNTKVWDLEIDRQAVPFFYWKRFFLIPPFGQASPVQYFSFPLNAGYGFLITEMFHKSQSQPGGLIKIEFVSIARSREYQLKPFYSRLISTPGDQREPTAADPAGTVYYAVSSSPVDQGALGRSATAGGPKNRVPLYIMYQYNENVMVKCKIDSTNYTNLAEPTFLDIVLSGYLIPEISLLQWKKKYVH